MRSMERPFTLVMPGTRLVKLGHDGGVVARMSEAICGIEEAPDVAEPVIGRAFARPVGSSGLRRSQTCVVPDKRAYASAIRDP